MTQETYPPADDFVAAAHVDRPRYEAMYAQSMVDPDGFWRQEAKRLDWIKAPTKIRDVSFKHPEISIKWFEDGVLNVSANCVDRHLAARGDETAIIWEPDDPKDPALHISYRELHQRVGKFANVLKKMGVRRATASASTCR